MMKGHRYLPSREVNRGMTLGRNLKLLWLVAVIAACAAFLLSSAVPTPLCA